MCKCDIFAPPPPSLNRSYGLVKSRIVLKISHFCVTGLALLAVPQSSLELFSNISVVFDVIAHNEYVWYAISEFNDLCSKVANLFCNKNVYYSCL